MFETLTKPVLEIFNRRPSTLESQVVKTHSQILEEAFEYIGTDTGLITSTGKSKLEEEHGLSVFEEMSRDSQIKAALSVKKYAVLGGHWEVHPFDESEKAKEIADFIKWNLHQLLGDRGLGLDPIMTAFPYGRSVSEKVYQPIALGKWKGNWALDAIKPKNPGFIHFEVSPFGGVTQFYATDLQGKKVTVQPDKIIHYAWDSEFDNPYGRSDLSSCYQWYWAKKTLYKYMLIFADKYACPIPVATIERALTTTQDTSLTNALKNFHITNSIKVPKGVELDFHQTAGTAGAFYIQAMNYCNSEMTRAILAQTLSTNENTRTGTHAQAKVHKETLQYILDKVQNDIERNVVQRQIIKPLVELNYGAQEGYPRFEFATYDIDYIDKLAGVMETLCNTSDINGNNIVEASEEWVRERLNMPKRDTEKFPLRTEPLEMQLGAQQNEFDQKKDKEKPDATSSRKQKDK